MVQPLSLSMPHTAMTTPPLPSDEERTLLRDSVRGFLHQHWPASSAVVDTTPVSGNRQRALWRGLADMGVATLGTEPGEGGLREVLLVMEELGRAACPAPLLSAALLNLMQLPDTQTPLAAMREGRAFVVLAVDGADAAPALQWADGRLSGELPFVEAAGAATHFALLVHGSTLVFVEADSPGMQIESTPAMGAAGPYRLRLQAVPGGAHVLPAGTADRLRALSSVGLAGRAWGAAQRAFELVVDYAKVRHQFGQPIGRFQAIQHKLANIHIALQGLQLCADNAARQHDLHSADWP